VEPAESASKYGCGTETRVRKRFPCLRKKFLLVLGEPAPNTADLRDVGTPLRKVWELQEKYWGGVHPGDGLQRVAHWAGFRE
jgi:hypothetical protein